MGRVFGFSIRNRLTSCIEISLGVTTLLSAMVSGQIYFFKCNIMGGIDVFPMAMHKSSGATVQHAFCIPVNVLQLRFNKEKSITIDHASYENVVKVPAIIRLAWTI